jgi:hypothetical protein
MNKISTALFLSVLFSSCAFYALHTGTEKVKSITDIPLQPHQHNVDVYFNADLPTQPYYKVQMVEATAPDNASYEDLLNTLKQRAREIGVDAVIIVDKQQATSYQTVSDAITVRDSTVYRDRQVATAYQRIAGIGLKYYSNIDYMESIVKRTIIDVYENGKTRKLVVNFDYYGNLLPANMDKYAVEFYNNQIIPFDAEQHLAGNMAGWEYSYDENEKVAAYRLSQGETIFTSARLQLAVQANTAFIDYQFFDPSQNKKQLFTLLVYKDENGKVLQTQLYQSNRLIWKEIINYKENLVIGYSRYAVENGSERLLLKADNYFYTKDDLPLPINPIGMGIKK